MLLVYAMTRAASDGWGSDTTLALLAGSAALVLAFVLIELRSPFAAAAAADVPTADAHRPRTWRWRSWGRWRSPSSSS